VFREACGSSSVMLARAAEWNCSIFRKEGKHDIETVIKSYIELAVLTNNPFPLTKYTIQNILRELQESPRGKRFLATQTIGEIW
jgi:tRNA-dihydrouridine synthase 2